MMLTFGSLFAGIGGVDLGLERAGMVCKWQVEIDPFCRKVLAKHWPDVRRYEDVRECGRHNLETVDLIAGGFPCQDISHAGIKRGIKAERSGLWKEFKRIIGELRPKYVIVENVAALLVRGMETVCGDLAECGYDAEWENLPAGAFGAEHIRERIFIVAYSNGFRQLFASQFSTESNSIFPGEISGLEWRKNGNIQKRSKIIRNGITTPITRTSEPYVCGTIDGVPDRVDRLRTLGNAVVPQVAEWIGRQIMEHANARK
jgi:DNA (cytosine-5)-methyltransferase 1